MLRLFVTPHFFLTFRRVVCRRFTEGVVLLFVVGEHMETYIYILWLGSTYSSVRVRRDVVDHVRNALFGGGGDMCICLQLYRNGKLEVGNLAALEHVCIYVSIYHRSSSSLSA